MVRKIPSSVPEAELTRDLEKYRQRAIELGAADAKIITASAVIIDERVRAKCVYPKCPGYGTNANCPPFAMDLDLFRKVVQNFHFAIFYKLEVPAAEVIGKGGDISMRTRSTRVNHEIVSKLEAEAFYDGYYLALGLAGGSCKTTFCLDSECTALVPGQACRNPFRARSSIEAVGIDGFKMAREAGWDMYPVGRSTTADDIPCVTKLGLVLIQ